jgi:bisphosphoglycerate-dependent phosphoglycerate mutase
LVYYILVRHTHAHVSLRYHYTPYIDMSVERQYEEQAAQAAQVIQKQWRLHQKRQAMSPKEVDGRWEDALIQAQAQVSSHRSFVATLSYMEKTD